MMNLTLKNSAVLISLAFLTACAGTGAKTEVKAPTPAATQSAENASTKPGAYYLDDGPGDVAPADIDGIPDAQLSVETPLERANKPYSALGLQYSPLTAYKPYKKQGVASWYGKRYHGKQTASGEVYDMYSMTAAHTTLPIPSYARVTNPANGRSVVVRINDRGPFKNDRLIDLSYAAAYKLRLAEQGSALVEVEMLDTSSSQAIAKALRKTPVKTETINNTAAVNKAVPAPVVKATPPVVEPVAVTTPLEIEPVVRAEDTPVKPAPVAVLPTKQAVAKPVTSVVATPVAATIPTATPQMSKKNAVSQPGYYVQAGAFKSEANSRALQQKIQGLTVAKNASLDSVYNDGLYRVKLGPYASKKDADTAANVVRKELGISAIVKN